MQLECKGFRRQVDKFGQNCVFHDFHFFAQQKSEARMFDTPMSHRQKRREDSSLSFQSPPPDASDISSDSSPVSSRESFDRRNPHSLRPFAATSARAQRRGESPVADSQRAAPSNRNVFVQDQGLQEDCPLVSRAPSRGASHGSNESVDITSMHLHAAAGTLAVAAPLASKRKAVPSSLEPRVISGSDDHIYDSSTALDASTRTVSSLGSSVQRAPFAVPGHDDEGLQDVSMLTPGSHRSNSTMLTRDGAVMRFLNNASKHHWERDAEKVRQREEKERLWREHVQNQKAFRRSQLDAQKDSVLQHRLFNLQVRQMKKEQDLMRLQQTALLEATRLSSPDAVSTTKRHVDPACTAGANGLTCADIDSYFDDYIRMVVPDQLQWIEKAGDRARDSVAPLMAQGQRRENLMTKPKSGNDAKEEKWFAAAKKRAQLES